MKATKNYKYQGCTNGPTWVDGKTGLRFGYHEGTFWSEADDFHGNSDRRAAHRAAAHRLTKTYERKLK